MFGYRDEHGNLTVHFDGEGHMASFEYDDHGRLIKVIDPMSRALTYHYDAQGRLVSSTDHIGLKPCFTNEEAQNYAENIIKKHGGIRTDENLYQMPHRRAARQASSEIAGDLGSNPHTITKSEFRRGPYSWKNSSGRIGVRNFQETAGWRDNVLGHPAINSGPHVNAWNESKGILHNLHLDY